MRQLRHLLEYMAMRMVLFLLDHMAPSMAERLARPVGHVIFLLHSRRRHIAVDNLIRAGITQDPHEARRIACASFQHFTVLIVDMLKAGTVFTQENWQQKVILDFDPETRRLMEDPKQGILLVSGHFGNWEIAAQLLSYLKPIVGVARPMDNPYVNHLMERRNAGTRFRVTPKHDAQLGRLLQVLKQGQVLALLADQHASRSDMVIPFFGRPAYTHTSPALLHFITRTPIVFGYCLRTGPMRYTLHLEAPLRMTPTGNRDADVRHVIETLNGFLETAIRKNPEQYLWAHRRWKELRPIDETRSILGTDSAQLASG